MGVGLCAGYTSCYMHDIFLRSMHGCIIENNFRENLGHRAKFIHKIGFGIEI